MFNHQAKIMMAAALTALPLVLGAADSAAAADRPFTFTDAEYMDRNAGMAAARTFVASQLRTGMPIAQARERLAQADMGCRTATGFDGPLACEYTMLAGGDGGDLGEDVWKVRLTANDQGNLRAAKVGFQRYGMEP